VIEALRMNLDFRNLWRQQSVNRRIFSALMTVGGLTLVVNLAATAKELVVANQFGAGDALDALLIAFLLPSYAINVLAGSCSTALVPTFVQVRENEGQVKAQQLLSGVIISITIVLAVLSVLLGLTVSFILPILGSGFSISKLALTRSLSFVFLPILVISGIKMTWAAVLNACERFALAALSPGMIPLATIAILLLMGRTWGIYALAVGALSGYVIEAGLLGWGLKRNGFCVTPHWHGLDQSLRKVIKQYIPVVAGALLMSGTMLVDQSMAAMLATGSVATLNYGGKVVTLILGIGSVSLSTAVFPHFSRMVAGYNWTGVRHTLKTYTYLILIVTIPLTLILVYFSAPLVRLLFERGAFTSMDTWRVSQVQALFLLQLPFYFLGILMVRLISSLNMNHILMRAAVINLSSKIVFNYLLMQRLGAAGIALSTTLVYVVSLIYCSVMLSKQMKTRVKHGNSELQPVRFR
jgi:putative peptidoglycan lipid II flippase